MKKGMCHVEIIAAIQTHIHGHKNLKKKLHSCSANICLNKECLRCKLIPNGTKIKMPNTSKASNQTYKQVEFLRIKD